MDRQTARRWTDLLPLSQGFTYHFRELVSLARHLLQANGLCEYVHRSLRAALCLVLSDGNGGGLFTWSDAWTMFSPPRSTWTPCLQGWFSGSPSCSGGIFAKKFWFLLLSCHVEICFHSSFTANLSWQLMTAPLVF